MATKLGVDGVTFDTLWSTYVSGAPCTNPEFTNQCAIRISEVLLNNGFTMQSFRGARCYGDSSRNAGKHIIRAEELANWLRRSPIPGMGPTQEVAPENYTAELDGKTGIIFFKDYYTLGNQRFENRSGDHIDLWNGSRTTGNWFQWTRELQEDIGVADDREASREIWFWEIK
jgi:hypothetical protein